MRVAVLAGGKSSEHEISQLSAQAVVDALSTAGHETLKVVIDRDGSWSYQGEPVVLTPGDGLLGVDVVFPALHGPYGEDGTVQGLLDCLAVPYVGSDVLASASCMDKLVFKQLITPSGYEQVDFVAVLAANWVSSREELLAQACQLGFPQFVKPSRLGSSVGISKVNDPEQLPAAIELALGHDPRVIIEQFSPGREIECSVLEVDGDIQVSVPGEIAFEADWYDYDAKYSDGGMELVVPAPISSEATAKLQQIAQAVFQVMGCSGLARADFFVEDERILINELNTMPGFTQTSVYAKLFEASGIPYSDLIERLLASALARHERLRQFSF